MSKLTESLDSLNESPSEKEGKFDDHGEDSTTNFGLNESPSEKEGKLRAATSLMPTACCLNESPSEKEGKYFARHTISTAVEPQ